MLKLLAVVAFTMSSVAMSSVGMTSVGMTSVGMSSVAMASSCPLGSGEDHLTIQRVMRNFGKFTAAADDVLSSASTPIDDDVVKAINDLTIVEACASESALSTSPDLIPPSARKDASAAVQFKKEMTAFQLAVNDEEQALQAARSSHDFTTARAKKKIVDDLADAAHSHF